MQAGTLLKAEGDVEADETFVGGLAKNMHRATLLPLSSVPRSRMPMTMALPAPPVPVIFCSRLRGTLELAKAALLKFRFIPACAGNAPDPAERLIVAPVHPRVCGERVKIKVAAEMYPRFIPACAGNAHKRHRGNDRHAVHPRVCGERVDAGSHARDTFGSSPRVRGTQMQAVGAQYQARFIPACAGNAFGSGALLVLIGGFLTRAGPFERVGDRPCRGRTSDV